MPRIDQFAEEELYDSLEEVDYNRIISSDNNTSDLSLLVPYYYGDVLRSELFVEDNRNDYKIRKTKKSRIPVLKRDKSCSGKDSSSNYSTGSKTTSTILTNNSHSTVKYTEEPNTYLKKFYAKMGYPVEKFKETNTDSEYPINAMTYRTAHSRESSISSDYSDAQASSSNSLCAPAHGKSYLEKESECDTRVPRLNLFTDRRSCVFNQRKDMCVGTKLKSKTMQNLQKFGKTKYLEHITTLGSLGPDLENVKDKLDQLRKRNEYGKMVSNKNRLKILEKKLLNNLNAAQNFYRL